MMEEPVERIACTGDDMTPLTVIRYRYCREEIDGGKTRWRRGAERLALSTGEAVRHIDATTFEVIATGEILLRHR